MNKQALLLISLPCTLSELKVRTFPNLNRPGARLSHGPRAHWPKGTLTLASSPPAVSGSQKRLGPGVSAKSMLDREQSLEKDFGGPWITDFLDQIGEVRIDDRTEDQYWFFPFMGSYAESCRILRKDTNLAEIAVGGLAAGMLLEFAVSFLSYPFDTVKTRLQAKPREALKRRTTFSHLYDGFGQVALTIPATSVFWATKDVVRTSILGAVQQGGIPWPVLDTFATGIGSILGEAIYWMIKAPSEVSKTQTQATALQEERQQYNLAGGGATKQFQTQSQATNLQEEEDTQQHNLSGVGATRQFKDHFVSFKERNSSSIIMSHQQDFLSLDSRHHHSVDLDSVSNQQSAVNRSLDASKHVEKGMEQRVSLGMNCSQRVGKQCKNIIRQVVKAWPVLALADVPYIGLRTSIFVPLHDSGLIPSGVATDGLLFLFATVIAAMLTTPLDVVRTQMLLKGSNLEFGALPSIVKELYYKKGILAFLAGWSPRVLYKGFVMGFFWGLVRQGYHGIRSRFLLDVLPLLSTQVL